MGARSAVNGFLVSVNSVEMERGLPAKKESYECMAYSEGYISVNTKRKIENLGSFNSP